MKPHNRLIYHCVSCGAVKRIEPGEKEPVCCGTTMVKAAAETVGIDEADDTEDSPQTPTVPNFHSDPAEK